jgi:hypothetical protein
MPFYWLGEYGLLPKQQAVVKLSSTGAEPNSDVNRESHIEESLNQPRRSANRFDCFHPHFAHLLFFPPIHSS